MIVYLFVSGMIAGFMLCWVVDVVTKRPRWDDRLLDRCESLQDSVWELEETCSNLESVRNALLRQIDALTTESKEP
jgi:hypothetical protein